MVSATPSGFATCISTHFRCIGPPGQVAAVAGAKAGMKQGELGGILKELGYTEDQVGPQPPPLSALLMGIVTGLQVLGVGCSEYIDTIYTAHHFEQWNNSLSN